MVQNRVFFPQSALDGWLADGKVDLRGDELELLAEGRKYRIVEAAHVIRELTGADDVHLLVGRVKTHAYLTALGAELLENSMVLSDLAYDVMPGFLGTPVGTFEAHLASVRAPALDAAFPPDSGPSGLELNRDPVPTAALVVPAPPAAVPRLGSLPVTDATAALAALGEGPAPRVIARDSSPPTSDEELLARFLLKSF